MQDAGRGVADHASPHWRAHLPPRPHSSSPTAPHRTTRRRRDILDISSPLSDAAAAIVDDSFLRCFKSSEDDPWNWNAYLFPLWAMGVVVRTLILFPLRSVSVAVYFSWLAGRLVRWLMPAAADLCDR